MRKQDQNIGWLLDSNLDVNSSVAPISPENISSLLNSIEATTKASSDLAVEAARLKVEVSNLRWWLIGVVGSAAALLIVVLIAFMQWQASWLQHSLDRTWDVTMSIVGSANTPKNLPPEATAKENKVKRR